MKQFQIGLSAIGFSLGLGLCSVASAQSTPPTTPLKDPTAADNTMKATAPGNTFSGWMTDYSKAHNGRISRQAYMDEAGRRWDAMDKNKQGLTATQINGMYGWNSLADDNSMSKGK